MQNKRKNNWDKKGKRKKTAPIKFESVSILYDADGNRLYTKPIVIRTKGERNKRI